MPAVVLFNKTKNKQNQIARINEMYSGAPRIAELHLMLEKEIKLLNGIERQRTKVRAHLQDQKIEKELDKMGMPIKWIGYRGKSYCNELHINKS